MQVNLVGLTCFAISSVEHPQADGQVEAANKVVLQGLKKSLDEGKGAWTDEFGSVLWSYQTTSQPTTLFKLTFRVDAMIPGRGLRP